MAKKSQGEKLFDVLANSVQQMVESDERFKDATVILECDYRGFKYDALTVRVYKQPRDDGRTGIISRPVYR